MGSEALAVNEAMGLPAGENLLVGWVSFFDDLLLCSVTEVSEACA